MKRNRAWHRAVVAATALMLAAGVAYSSPMGETPAAAAGKAEKVVIEIWTPRQPEEDAVQQRSAQRYEAANPNVDIQFSAIPGGQGAVAQKLQLGLAGGAVPDLADISWVRTQEWAARGALTPLSDRLARDASAVQPEDFVPSIWSAAQFDGKLFALPYTTDARALFYNKKLFQEAGLDPARPPKDWNELAEQVKKLTRQDASGRLTQVGLIPTYDQGSFLQWLRLNGGAPMPDDMRTATFNGPLGVEALSFIGRLVQSTGAQSLQTFQQGIGQAEANPFYSGRLAAWFTGPWVFPDVKKYAPEIWERHLALAPLPPAPGKQSVSLAGGFALMMPKGAKNPDAAWAFIKWFTGREEQVRVMQEGLWLPVRGSVAQDMSWQKNPHLAVILAAVKTSTPFVTGPVVGPFYTAMGTAVDEHILTGKPAKDALDAAAAAVQKELDAYYRK